MKGKSKEVGGQRSEVRGRRSEVGDRKSGTGSRGQEAGDRRQGTEVGSATAKRLNIVAQGQRSATLGNGPHRARQP
jgi:hypothetical protein